MEKYKKEHTGDERIDWENEVFHHCKDLIFSLLEVVRVLFYKVLQNREISIKDRAYQIIEIANECQNRVDEDDIFGINDVIDEYETKLIQLENEDDYYERTLPRFKSLYELEVLNDLWADLTDEAAALIYGEGTHFCNELHKEFETWLDNNIQENSIMWEQILIYFISTYFCGAVYDGNIIGKVQMSVTSLLCIYEMIMARWLKNDKHLDFEDIAFITYMYSRELEHSDINLDTMENIEY